MNHLKSIKDILEDPKVTLVHSIHAPEGCYLKLNRHANGKCLTIETVYSSGKISTSRVDDHNVYLKNEACVWQVYMVPVSKPTEAELKAANELKKQEIADLIKAKEIEESKKKEAELKLVAQTELELKRAKELAELKANNDKLEALKIQVEVDAKAKLAAEQTKPLAV